MNIGTIILFHFFLIGWVSIVEAQSFSATVTDLGTLGGVSEALDISDSGQVAGFVGVEGVNEQAFLWSPGTGMLPLSTPTGFLSRGVAINKNGWVAGLLLSDNCRRKAVVWRGGISQSLPEFEPCGSEATGINDLGVVVGNAYAPPGLDELGREFAVRWRGGGKTVIGAPRATASAINNRGEIIGSFTDFYRQVFWGSGSIRPSRTILMSTNDGYVTALNNNSRVVGVAFGNSTNSAFLWSSGSGFTPIPSIAPFMEAKDINDSDQVVGTAESISGIQRAFIYDPENGTRDLNTLLPLGSGWVLLRANAINNKGQIVGAGIFQGQQRAFLLSPPLEVDLVDPACSQQTTCTGKFLRSISGNTTGLISDKSILVNEANVDRQGVIADGVSQLMIRVKSDSPVTFSLKELGNTEAGEEFGILLTADSDLRGNTVTVTPEQIEGNSVAFALYRAPNTSPNFVQNEELREKVKLVTESAGRTVETLISIIPPPVLLVHGIWGNPGSFPSMPQFLKSAGFPTLKIVDYKIRNAGSFDPTTKEIVGQDPNQQPIIPVLINFIEDALRVTRSNGYAASQVDIVGHSMGGLVARSRTKFKDGLSYKRLSNYNAGDIHKIIFIGTPHRGSFFANIVIDNRDRQIETKVLKEGGTETIPITLEELLTSAGIKFGKGLEELRTLSLALNRLGRTEVPSHVIVGKAPSVTNIEVEKNILLNTFGLDVTVDELQCGDGNHDVTVAVISQQGGFSGPDLTSVFSNVVHAGKPIPGLESWHAETESPDIKQRVLELLKTSLDTSPEKFSFLPVPLSFECP